MTRPSLTVWPHCEVPPPRGVTVRPSSRAMASARKRLVHAARHHDTGRHDLVERGVGGVAAAAEGIEQDVAGDLAAQPSSASISPVSHSLPSPLPRKARWPKLLVAGSFEKCNSI